MKVLLGIPCGRGDSRIAQEESLFRLVEHSRKVGIELSAPCVCAGAYIAENRNRLLERAHREGYDACIQLDSDMLPPPNFAEALAALDAPLASGLCFLGGPPFCPSAFMLIPPEERDAGFPKTENWRDTPFPKTEDWRQWPFLPYRNIDPIMDVPFEVDATGGACLFIHRVVWETLHPRPFWLIYEDDHYFPEDLLFCLRWQRASGRGVVVHPDIEVGHLRPSPIRRDTWQRYKLRQEQEKQAA